MPDELFILRPEHEQAFADAALRRFNAKARKILRTRHAASLEGVPEERLASLVGGWMTVSRAAGLLTEEQMFRYIEAGVLLMRRGLRIENDRPITRLLRATDKSADERSLAVEHEARTPAPGTAATARAAAAAAAAPGGA